MANSGCCWSDWRNHALIGIASVPSSTHLFKRHLLSVCFVG
jgi:hypothetical protein